ncbi:MAG: dihydroorotate oxidase [Candidatus Diapherotrites archaeon]|nr:dihydroorotate oxidase [Candidatus Diapherotrites archaeon]
MDWGFEHNGIAFKSRVMNASGPLCASESELALIGASASAGIITKSMTFSPRDGNERPKYFENDLGSINSNGLENLGYRAYCGLLPELRARFQKPLIASCVGFSLLEFETIVRAVDTAGADIIEANLSCPNIAGKPQVAYDFDTAEKYLSGLRSFTDKPLWIKLPPYFEEVHRREMANLLLKYRIDGAVLINSVGNALVVDPVREQTVIKPKDGLGGLGGKYIKPVALANVWSFYRELKDRIPIVGVGGVYSGTDAFEFLLCGAQLVQVGSAFKSQGTGVFARIQSELDALVAQKKYAAISDFLGKLRVVESSEYGFEA